MKNGQENNENENNLWDEGLIVFNNIEEQISFQQTNEFDNDEQIKVIQNFQDSKKKKVIDQQVSNFENVQEDQIFENKQTGQREQFGNYTENSKNKQNLENSVQYLIEEQNNLDIQIQENKQKLNNNKSLINSCKTEGVVLSKGKLQLKRSNSELQITSEANLKNNYKQNKNQKRMLSANDIIDLDQSTNQIFTKATTIQKEEKEDSKQTIDLNQDLIQNQGLKMQQSQNQQEDEENQSLRHVEQNPISQENQIGDSQIINSGNQAQNVSQQENQLQQDNNQNQPSDQIVAAPQNQSDEYTFQLQQTQAYISSLRYRLDLRTQSINSLNSILCQKLKFKKVQLIIYYFPLCVGFLYLLIRNAAQFCSPTILIHFCLYTFFSLRNFIINVYVYIKSQQHLKVLKLYDVNALSHDLFFFLICDLQTQYKKQKDLQNKIEQISIQQPQDQEQAIQNDSISNSNNNNANVENNNAINIPQNNYMSAQQNIQILNNQQAAANDNIQMHQIDQNIPEEYVQLIIAAIKYQQSQQQQQSQVNNIVNQNNSNSNSSNQQQDNNVNNNNSNNNQNQISFVGLNNNNIISNNQVNNNNNNEIQNDQNINGANNDNQNKQSNTAIENYYLIQAFNLSINIIKDSNILKSILLNSPNIRENRMSYDYYQKHLFQINHMLNSNLRDTDYLIENNQQMIYQINSNLIQREIETIIKYKDRVFLSKIIRVYSFLEEYYLVIYNLLEFTFSFCYPSEINVAIVFSFYYSIVNWLQIIIVTFAIIFMLIALIFYLVFQLLACKRKKELKTQSLNDIKNTLQSTKKYTEQELSELCCIICLVEFEEKDQVYLSECCKRCFHKGCIMEWFKVNQKCPMCRAVVLQ
ncbi:hypothetical protein ABPG74_009797 [Tetrahymena malaccensis]